MLAINSMGFGHGAFGHTYFGHGPWVTFPHTPDYSYTAGRRYAMERVQFESLDEQRFLRGRAQGLRLGYSWLHASSATVAAIRSWYIAAGGPYTRFRAFDHWSGSAYIVRFLSAEFTDTYGPGMQRQISELGFEISRPDSGAALP